MDQKKRRNSILKKPPTTDDENTAELTTKIKRRISFSGKKSVKEFLAGEEQATIWGTSYEESAECLHANTTESAVVGVNDKRIVLRNRRVVVETNRSNKRRSKKKVHVAENDKENVFTQTPQVEIEHPSDPVRFETSNKGDSPAKSELVLVKSNVQNVRTMMEQLDSMNACSTTFDFINYSGAINRTVTIEQSVDVSLDENELQMYKFRVPVSALDVSPNLSLNRDGSSPNIFSSSLLMSDEDMKMLKLMKAKMGGLISTGEPLQMIESAEKIVVSDGNGMAVVEVERNLTSADVTGELPTQDAQRKTITETGEMEIVGGKGENEIVEMGRTLEAKNLKRKTIAAATKMDETSLWPESSGKHHATVMDSVMMDVHSPMRKKPMHKQTNRSMEISAIVIEEQKEPPRRETIHFESAVVDESLNDEVRLNGESTCGRQTIHFDQNQIHEDTVCQENDDHPPVAENDHMELSLVDVGTRVEMSQGVTERKSKKRQSIRGPVDILEESPNKCNNAVRPIKRGEPSKLHQQRESIYVPTNIVEDSPKQPKPSQSSRDSVYTPTDIVEESPKPAKEREAQRSKPNDRQTIYNTDIVEEVSVQCVTSALARPPPIDFTARGAVRRTNVAPVDMVFDAQHDERSTKDRKSIYTPSEMIEDEQAAHGEDYDFKRTAQGQKSIYVASDMVEDSPRVTRTSGNSAKPVGRGTSIGDGKPMCAPTEDSSNLTNTITNHGKFATQGFKVGCQGRKSIYTPSDMIENSPETQKPSGNRKTSKVVGIKGLTDDQISIHAPADMIEDSPKVQKESENPKPLKALGTKKNVYSRKSIYTLSDMIEDSPKLIRTNESNSKPIGRGVSIKGGKSIYASTEIVEDSSDLTNVNTNRKFATQGFISDTRARKSIYMSADMIEDSPKVQKTSEHRKQSEGNMQSGKSLYTHPDMVEGPPEMQKTSESCRRDGVSEVGVTAHDRKLIYTPTEMVENSSRMVPNENNQRSSVQGLKCAVPDRKSIYTATDMIEDSPKVPRPTEVPRQGFKGNPSDRKSIYMPSDIVEESFNPVKAGKTSSKRQSIYTSVDIVEDFPKASHTNHVMQRQMSVFDGSPDETLDQKCRHTIFEPKNIREDSPVEEFKSRSLGGQSNCIVETESTKFSRNSASYSQVTSMPRVTSRHTIYAPADILEDSPPKLSKSRNPYNTQFARNSSTDASSSGVSTRLQSPEAKATSRKTVCAPCDILADSPTTKVRHSIYTPEDIVVDSPKMPVSNDPQPVASAPKVIVRHVTLQQGIMGDNAAMRILKHQQTKAKVPEPVRLNESAMDMSVVESAPPPTIRTNFSKLNEQMVRGEVKAFPEEHKNKKSLFDHLEMVAADGPHFDSFQKKPAAMTGYQMQPKRGSFNDYTFELTRNTFDGQRRQGNEYTMDFSSRMLSKVVAANQGEKAGEPNDLTNISIQMSPLSNGVSEKGEVSRNTRDSKWQTIHFHNEDEMDVSTSVNPQDAGISQPHRQTILFHEQFELDKSSTQTYPNKTGAAAFEKNPRTAHFEKNNHMEETKHVSNVRVDQIVQDVSTMDVSAQDDGLNNYVSFEPMKGEQLSEKLTRQSCIMRSSTLDAALNSIPSRQTICAPADILEVTRDPREQQNDTMDLSASIFPPSSQSELREVASTSIGRQRRTIHCNDDLELDDTGAHVSRVSQKTTSCLDHVPGSKKSTVTQSTHERQRASAIPTRIAGRKTIHFNQDLKLDDDKPGKPTENPKQSAIRQTIYFQHKVDMDESHSSPCKEDASKVLPKPRRMTTFDDVPVDVDESTEKITTRKSSFSRTLNFNEIAKATSKFQPVPNKDSPVFCYSSKLKRYESTTEIDRSLAEYLKAEAAATLYRCSPDNMDVVEQSPQSEYFDAEDEHVERGQFMVEPQIDLKRVQMLEESGMQPLQGTASRRDIEQSLPDDDVAAKQGEPTHDQSDMSFELRGLQANRLNHEFFDKEVSLSPKPQQAVLPRQMVEHLKARRQTILEPEPMMEQSVTESLSPEEPVESIAVISQPNRKTIHFTNEDAVDESFFDENVSKPAAAKQIQSNRHTVYFNESQNSIDDMDTSLTQNIPETQAQSQIGRSMAAQSMKDILRESNMLFTQSMLKPHYFEAKKSTVFFDAKDISLDTAPAHDNSKQDENTESTPTKANKSRIPQLIGSAKKLQSMKKSMEFIQQNLPNLATKDEDTFSRQTDNAAEIHQDETSFSCQPEQFHDSLETIEIARKVVANEPKLLQESFDTVEIPRRATTFQRNDTLYLCQNEVDITNISEKSNFRFEDVPITISDVSTYFTQKHPPMAKQTKEGTYSPNTTEALCNLDMNKFADETQVPKSSDSEDTAYNFDKFKKRYVELTCESINSTGFNEDIEKTHLSLVNTLDEHESEVVRDTCSEPPQPELALPLETTISSVCRKCKRHKQTVSQNDTTISSFVLAPLPEYKMDLATLSELRNKPRVFDVAKVWRQNLRESDSFNISDGKSAIDLEDDETMDNLIASLDNERRMAAQQRQRKEFKHETSFVHTVRQKLQSKKSNWILNDLLLTQNILKFTHTRIRTFAIFISFTKKDPRGVEVEFNEMRVVPNALHSRVWTAFDYALHYQLLVELPFDLSTLCPKSENLFQLLEHVECVTQDVLKTGRDVLYLVLSSPASLIREPSGGIYIRKYARTRTAQNEVKRTEFQIEVRNMKRLSYESITQPPLYEFDEKIQLLPTGQDFLRVFLADPLRYMKS